MNIGTPMVVEYAAEPQVTLRRQVVDAPESRLQHRNGIGCGRVRRSVSRR